LLQFFIQNLDSYLDTGFEKQQISFLEVLRYGEPSITSEVIARLAEVIAYCEHFNIRTRALKLIDSFILWGDVEALLVVNYTEHAQLVIKSIWNVEGHNNLDAGKFIYPEIEGQKEEKK
jgi:hypothetical protein